MGRSPLVDRLAAEIGGEGFNLIGAAHVSAYDAVARPDLALATRFPWARSAVIVGNGGGALWRRVVAFAEQADGLVRPADPVDSFVEHVVANRVRPWLAHEGRRAHVVVAHLFDEDPLSFVDLALAAELGSPSLLRVLVHPVFGPWMALRFAILVEDPLEGDRPARGFDPCPTCVERACVAACPAGAVRSPEGWDVDACVDHRRRSGDCESRCHARFDCVIGREHRYPPEALAHHHGRAWERMRTLLPETGG